MGTYLMFGRYSQEAMGKISRERTVQAAAAISDAGGQFKAGYATLGEKDLLLIVGFPGTKEAMKASVALTKLLGIRFATVPAVTLEEFDKLIAATFKPRSCPTWSAPPWMRTHQDRRPGWSGCPLRPSLQRSIAPGGLGPGRLRPKSKP